MKNGWNHLRHLILSLLLLVHAVSAQTDLALDQQIADCAKNAATEWSPTTNKCVVKVKAQAQRNGADGCNALADIGQRETCHQGLAEANTGLSADTNKLNQGKTTASMAINSAYSIISLINFTGTSNAKSNCTSKKIFGVSAVAGLATDAFLKVKAKKKVDALNNKFKLDVKNGASDSQVKALEYLKDEQKTVLEIAGLEKKRNLLLTLGYGAAGVMAAYELTPWGKNPECELSTEKTPGSSETPDPDSSWSKKLTSAGAATISKIKTLTNNSLGILVMSAIGTVYSGVLYNAASEQESESKSNVEKIDKVIKTFKDSYANFCPNGRENLTEPKCYCYNADGKQNPNRSNSQTCAALWAKDNFKIAVDAGDYTGAGGVVPATGCVNMNAQFDEKCVCKKFIDQKGANACMKTTNLTIPSGLGASFSGTSGLQQVTALANNAANGNPKLDLFTGGQLASNAIAAKKMAQAIFTKLTPELPASAIALSKMNDKNVNQFARSALGDGAMQEGLKGPSSAIGVAETRSTDEKVAALLKNAEQKAGLDLMGSGKGLAHKKADGKEGPNFNFIGESTASANGAQTQSFPETQKAYNYKNNDISKKDDNSIFDIISNRYIQSGLKRLFDH